MFCIGRTKEESIHQCALGTMIFHIVGLQLIDIIICHVNDIAHETWRIANTPQLYFYGSIVTTMYFHAVCLKFCQFSCIKNHLKIAGFTCKISFTYVVTPTNRSEISPAIRICCNIYTNNVTNNCISKLIRSNYKFRITPV